MANETQLAVILHADVVGSTGLVHADELLAHERIQAAFRALSELISKQRGVPHEVRGDALVAEFARPSDAVTAALEFQAANAERNRALPDALQPHIRIGIAMGEVVIADGTVTGAGVVLAQRLEQVAPQGRICVSAAIREATPGWVGVRFEDLGLQQLKGFDAPQQACLIESASRQADPIGRKTGESASTERPGVAVLPFESRSAEVEQAYFADGITEDVIAALSRFKELLVIARNTMFTYKDQSIDVADVAKQLGVSYVVEGSVRRAGERIRVTVELVNATQRAPIWSERYDRRLEDIFDVQDDITEKVVGTIAPAIQLAEEQRASANAPSNLDAWGQYHLGLSERQITREGVARMVERFTRAVTLDPRFAAAHTWLGLSRYYEGAFGLSEDRAGLLQIAHRHVQYALKLDDADAMARATAARILAAQGQHDAAMREAERAVEQNPNLWWAHLALATVRYYGRGDAVGALEALEVVERLNPRDRSLWAAHFLRALCLRLVGDLDAALTHGLIACDLGGHSYVTHLSLACTYALTGDQAGLAEALGHARALEPRLDVSVVTGLGTRHLPAQMLERIVSELRNAGLPDCFNG